ncbi:MAG: protein kinase [Proteobacteria bacterium]|nr:protein kinase [Pseudomonadota bacterium]
MADFKTTLERLARGEIDFDAVARNIDKLLAKRPQAVVAIMDQLKQAVVDGIIDADTYAALKSRVTVGIEAAPLAEHDAAAQGGHDDDATRLGGDESTRFGGHEVTEMVARARQTLGDATEILDITSGEITGHSQPSTTTGIDFDPTGDTGSQTSASWPTSDSQTGGTGGDWSTPSSASSPTRIEPGAVLRGRFKLDSVLGVGGMGSVFLGSDLIKVRAKDKQPRVALKVLNEDFKQHPDSFIALQREASRQQKLAHPNIATVYDFDQTEDGLAFLVMELLEGQPLNDYIKKVVRPKGGLPFAEALPMVQGLGAALVYAHERNIVHSDFKPGNCFLTKEGQMKVLDFGIARAVKNPGAAEGETTIFDPGKLGALTPAYASTEMLEGEEPDPRDDIYALACVAYELLTGKHPFNKIPANKARDSGLVAEPIKGLTRKQWRGLEHGLAFTRDKRSQTTAQFLIEFEGATSPWKNPLVMVPAAAVLLAAVGVVPMMNMLDKRDTDQRIELAKSGSAANIEQVLAGVDAPDFDSGKRDRILTEAKEAILAYFENGVRSRIDVAAGKYDFIGARQVLDKAQGYSVYHDSSSLNQLKEQIDEAENRVLAEQFDKFNTALENGSLLPSDNGDDIYDAMAVVAKIDPKHPMLKDRRLPGAFANAINKALADNRFDYGEALSNQSRELLGLDNKYLNDLADKIGGARERAETTARLLAAVDAVQKALDSKGGLPAYLAVQNEVVDLARLDPGNELLDKLRKDIEPRATRDLAALESSRNWNASDLMLGDYSGMLRVLGMRDLNDRIGTLANEFNAQLTTLRDGITQAVASNKLDPDGDDQLRQLGEIAARHATTANARDQLALARLHEARSLRDKGEFDGAAVALKAARAYTPSARVAPLLDAEAALADALRNGDDAARADALAKRHARFETALPDFGTRLAGLGKDAQGFSDAYAALDALRADHPDDPRTNDAANQLATMVEKTAEQWAGAERWDEAVALTQNALVDLPRAAPLLGKLDSLESKRKQALAAAEKQQVADAKAAIEKLLAESQADRAWRASVRKHMGNIAAFGDPKDPWIKEVGTKIAAKLVERAGEMRLQERFAEGNNLIADAARYAPDAPGLAEERGALQEATDAFEQEQQEQARLARIDGMKQTFESQAKAGDVANAAKTLDGLRKETDKTPDPYVSDEAPRLLASAYLKLATQQVPKNDFAAALRFAKACADLQPQRQDCKLAVRDYTVDGNKQELAKMLKRPDFDIGEALAKVSEVQILDPGEFSKAESGWAQDIATRIEALKKSEGMAANEVIKQAKDLFPGNQPIAAIEPVKLAAPTSRYAPDIKKALDKAMLSVAKDLLLKATKEEAENAEIVTLKGAFNARVKQVKEIVGKFDARFNEGKAGVAAWQADKQDASKDKANALLVAARGELDSAFAVWADNAALKQRKLKLEQEIAKLAGGVAPLEPPPPPTNPCEPKLAGHGKRKAGTCFYFVAAREPGPYLVVVPAGEGIAKPFAVGKFEVSVADFNRYCKLSGKCQPLPGQDAVLPVTGITLAQAQEYTKWLSERTGQSFRLPTNQEWTYAANAGGDQPKKDYNCRVEQAGQLLKGQGTMGVNTGKANGWGLYNYVGNAQEWVVDGGSVEARGGAFEDMFSKCDIALEKPHAGNADKATGFRVVLDLGS